VSILPEDREQLELQVKEFFQDSEGWKAVWFELRIIDLLIEIFGERKSNDASSILMTHYTEQLRREYLSNDEV